MDKKEYLEVVMDNIESTMKSVKADFIFTWTWQRELNNPPVVIKTRDEIEEYIRRDNTRLRLNGREFLIFISFEDPGWTTYGYYHDDGFIRPIAVTNLMKCYDRIYTSFRIYEVDDEYKANNPILYDILFRTIPERKGLANFTFYEIYGVEEYVKYKLVGYKLDQLDQLNQFDAYEVSKKIDEEIEICDMFFKQHMQLSDIMEKTGIPYYGVLATVNAFRPLYDPDINSSIDYKLFLELYDNALPMNIFESLNKAFIMRYDANASMLAVAKALHIKKATLTKIMALKYAQAHYHKDY